MHVMYKIGYLILSLLLKKKEKSEWKWMKTDVFFHGSMQGNKWSIWLDLSVLF